MVNMVRAGVGALQTRGIERVETMRYGCIIWLCEIVVCGGSFRVLILLCVLRKMA